MFQRAKRQLETNSMYVLLISEMSPRSVNESGLQAPWKKKRSLPLYKFKVCHNSATTRQEQSSKARASKARALIDYTNSMEINAQPPAAD